MSPSSAKKRRTRLLLAGSVIVTNTLLSPFVGSSLLLGASLGAASNLANDLFAAALDDGVSADSLYANIIENKRIEKAIHLAICTITRSESSRHQNRGYSIELENLSKVPFDDWETVLKLKIAEEEADLSSGLGVIGENLGHDSAGNFTEDDWYEILSDLETAMGIELHPTPKSNVAASLVSSFVKTFERSVSVDQVLVNQLVVKGLSQLIHRQQMSIEFLDGLTDTMATEIRKQLSSMPQGSGPSGNRFMPSLTEYFTGRRKVLTDIGRILSKTGRAS